MHEGRTDSHLSHPENFLCHIMLSYYVFHEFARVTGKANGEGAGYGTNVVKGTICSKYDFLSGFILP